MGYPVLPSFPLNRIMDNEMDFAAIHGYPRRYLHHCDLFSSMGLVSV